MLIPLASDDLTLVAHLFPRDLANPAMLHSVLEGNNPGQVFVDHETRPTACVVRTHFTFTFVSEGVTQPALDSIATRLRPMCLVWPAGGYRDLSPPPDSVRETPRFAFADRVPSTGTAHDDSLPEGTSLQPMTPTLLASCWWRGEVIEAFGTIQGFLDRGLGICLVRDGEVLSEAYGLFHGDGTMEIGVYTAREHRGQGHAILACAELIRRCEAQGLATYWSCDQSNTASASVARRLGYQLVAEYRLFEYR